MNDTVKNFFVKDDDTYATTYRLDHSPRLQALLDRYNLRDGLKGKSVVDVGGGLGFLGELLDPTTDYWVIDGADIPESKRLSKGHWLQFDLDYSPLQRYHLVKTLDENGKDGLAQESYTPPFDAGFCLETLEHLSNPYHALVEMKKLVKEDGLIYLSLPCESVWHNVVYPALLWPPSNFVQFLAQMSLHVLDHWEYKPAVRGWPAYQYTCINKPWSHKMMLYPKQEAKFLHATPLEMTNL